MKSKYLMIAALLSLFALAGCKRKTLCHLSRNRRLRRPKCRRRNRRRQAINPNSSPHSNNGFEDGARW